MGVCLILVPYKPAKNSADFLGHLTLKELGLEIENFCLECNQSPCHNLRQGFNTPENILLMTSLLITRNYLFIITWYSVEKTTQTEAADSYVAKCR